MPGTIRSVLRGERPVIRSDGTFIRDYIYVRDVVDAYLALGDHVTEDGVRRRGVQLQPREPRDGARDHA